MDKTNEYSTFSIYSYRDHSHHYRPGYYLAEDNWPLVTQLAPCLVLQQRTDGAPTNPIIVEPNTEIQ